MTERELDEILGAWTTPRVPSSLRPRLRASFAELQPRGRRRWLAAFALAAGMAAAVATSLLEHHSAGGETFRWDDHTYLVRTYFVEPGPEKMQWALTGRRTTGMRRQNGGLSGSTWLVKAPDGRRHGYNWTAKPDGQGRYRFTEQPLDARPAVSRIVGIGSSFDVDLYISGHERVYDHYEFFSKPTSLGTPPETPEAAAATISLTEPKLYVNGQPLANHSGVTALSSSMLVIDVPRIGHFTIALDARGDSRLAPAGTVDGHVLEFQSAGSQIRIECSAPIASGGERPIFVYAKPDPAVRRLDFGAGRLP